jgi:hypothetical protein
MIHQIAFFLNLKYELFTAKVKLCAVIAFARGLQAFVHGCSSFSRWSLWFMREYRCFCQGITFVRDYQSLCAAVPRFRAGPCDLYANTMFSAGIRYELYTKKKGSIPLPLS